MKTIIFSILPPLVASSVQAQQKQGLPTAPMQFDYGMMNPKQIGTSKIRILYAFQPENLADEDTWIDCGQLLVEGGMTQYSSRFVAVRDSSLRVWFARKPKPSYYQKELNLRGRGRIFWSEYQYGQIYTHGGQLTEWAVMPQAEMQQYRYSEPYPSMRWTLAKETAVICGYNCQKATCHWRGRDYVAWFTQDIPLKAGPWKFGGLPGLIMKIHDTKNLYLWQAVAVESGTFPIMQLDDKNFKDSTREKVWRMQRDFNTKYGEMSGRMIIGGGRDTSRHKYDQLELE